MMVTMAMNDEFFLDAATRAGIGGSIYSYLKRGFRMESRNPNSAPHEAVHIILNWIEAVQVIVGVVQSQWRNANNHGNRNGILHRWAY